MPADALEDKLSKKGLIDTDVLQQEADECERLLTALKVAYEQYFLGLERRPPTQQYEDFKKRVNRLKATFTKSTHTKFRINTLHQKFVTYERLWQRTLQEMEAGTYKRDLYKAKLHGKKGGSIDERSTAKKKDSDFDITEDLGDMGLDDALDEAAAAVSKPPPPPPAKVIPPVSAVVPGIAPVVPGVQPAAAAKPAAATARPPGATPSAATPAVSKAASATPISPRPAVATPPKPVSGDNVSDAKVKAIYDAYVTAKRRCGEDTSKLTIESVAQTVRKQVPELMKKHNAKGVDFKVVIKDGKALLRAVPKE